MIKEKSVSKSKGVGMQDDQAKSVDDIVKSAEDSAGDAAGLSLAGSPPSSPAKSDSSIPDPALEALEQKQSKQPSDDTDAPSTKEKTSTTSEPEGEPPAPPSGSPPEPPADTSTSSSTQADTSSLDPIKKEALQKLEPLVNELDLHPEEKYRALMMIIQATDNKDLVNEAYQAADKIEDSKTRAQALLSIVNEIEYFKNKDIASSNQ
ncbi:MAG TPA: hypothetical protein VFX79_03395 [Candidatus Saccharimonadales bacterium]|nr:hypothetical protein [Candidatus Saccharimonadales bacterium]